jgi:hypothetical protein
MGEAVAIAAFVIGGAVILFAASIRMGIVIGRRIDGALEARARSGETGSSEEVRTDE